MTAIFLPEISQICVHTAMQAKAKVMSFLADLSGRFRATCCLCCACSTSPGSPCRSTVNIRGKIKETCLSTWKTQGYFWSFKSLFKISPNNLKSWKAISIPKAESLCNWGYDFFNSIICQSLLFFYLWNRFFSLFWMSTWQLRSWGVKRGSMSRFL